MKKPLFLLAALALFAAVPAPAAEGDKLIGLQFGGSVPIGDLEFSARSGFEGAVVGTYMQSEQVGIGVDVAYHAWRGSDVANALSAAFLGPGSEFRINAVQVTTHVLYDYPTGGRARPYAKGGGGLYFVKTKLHLPSGEVDDMEANLGYNMGVGVNLNVSPMFDIGIGGMYHTIMTSGPEASFFTVGVNLTSGMSAR